MGFSKSTDEAIRKAATKLLASDKNKPTPALGKVDAAAVKAVRVCIELYQEAKIQREMAPRLGELCAQLKRVELIARELDDLLKDPRSLLQTELRTYALVLGHYERLLDFLEHSNSHKERSGNLQLLAESASTARRMRAVIDGSGDLEHPDRGGRFEPYIESEGTPRRALLLYCAATFAEYHGPEAVTYRGKGPFQKFVAAVWKAAGEDEDDLNPRTLRRELRELEESLRESLGKPIQGLADARVACFSAFAAGLRQPETMAESDQPRTRPR